MRYKKVGDILIDEGLISDDQLSTALEEQKRLGGRLGEVLTKLAFVTESQIISALAKQLGLVYVDYDSGKLKPEANAELDTLIPYEFAINNVCIPLSRTISSVSVAMSDPTDLLLMDNLRKITGCDINQLIASRSDIIKGIEDFYGKERIINDAIQGAYENVEQKEEPKEKHRSMHAQQRQELTLDKVISQSEDAPVVKLVDLIVHQAIEMKVSDIHLEARRETVALRYRIDGKLYEQPSPKKSMYLPLVSRIKILSKMDIAEKRLPQDGGYSVKLDDKVVDLRVSCLPTIYGEKIVIRILDQTKLPLDLSKIGYLPEELELIKKGITAPYGLVFLTGPTGSGKSTSLYSALNQILTPEVNVMTAEDPVEYKVDGINQVQVKTEIGLSFANVLRSFLRQDPDIILVGEVRDQETGEICLKAALTGHLVLSTLHTNDALSSVSRLVDMGLPSYLLGAALRLIIAQRLVRRLCPDCKEPYELTQKEYHGYKLETDIAYKAVGCENCNFIGYTGRTLISEVVLITDDIREMILNNASPREMMPVAQKHGSMTLFQSGLKRVEAGTTSIEEILAKAID